MTKHYSSKIFTFQKFNRILFLFLTLTTLVTISCSKDDSPVEQPVIPAVKTGSVIGSISSGSIYLEGVKITLKQAGQEDKSVIAGGYGVYKFENIPVGKITLVATMPYYLDKSTEVTIEAGVEANVAIMLEGDSSKLTQIPDAKFEEILIKYGYDTAPVNGSVPTHKISIVKNLSLNDSGVADLTGIQDFAALEFLSCTNLYGTSVIKLKNIDISKNKALKTLELGSNELTSIDISNNLALESLNISSNSISSIDVSKHTALTRLSLSYNLMTSVDVTNNVLLKDLYVSSVPIGSLDVSKNPALRSLYCDASALTTLDISKNPALEFLSCSVNGLKTIDLSNNSILKMFNGDNNEFSSLDFTKNTALTSLTCYGNKLTSIDVTKCAELTSLSCSSNLLLNLDVTQNAKLLSLNCSKNMLGTLDCSKNPLLATKEGYYLICSDNVLTRLNLKSGNNKNFLGANFLKNTSMLQIAVDDVAFSNEKWNNFKDAAATYVSEFQ